MHWAIYRQGNVSFEIWKLWQSMWAELSQLTTGVWECWLYAAAQNHPVVGLDFITVAGGEPFWQVRGPQMKKSATNIRLGARNRRSHVGLGVFKSKTRLVFASCGAPERCDSTWVCVPEWSAASGGWCYGSSSAYGTAAASSGEIRAGNLWGSPPENLLWIWAWAWWAWSTSGLVERPPVRTPRSSPCTARSWRSISAFTWARLKRVPKASQAVFIRPLVAMTLSSSVPAGVIASGPLLASICLNKPWACPWSLKRLPPNTWNLRAPPAQTFICIGTLFLLYAYRSYQLLCEEGKSPQTLTFMYSLCLPPSFLHTLFTLLLSLPSLQLNMDIWFIGKWSVTDHLLLVPSPAFLLPRVTKTIVHQLHIALLNYFLLCKNSQPVPGSTLRLPFLPLTPTDFAYSGCSTGPRGAVCWEVADFLGDGSSAFHMLRAYQEESHEGPLTIKSRGR